MGKSILDELDRLWTTTLASEFPAEQYRAEKEYERTVLKNAHALVRAARCLENMPGPSTPEFFCWQDARIGTLGYFYGEET